MRTVYKYKICTVPELVAGIKIGETIDVPENSKVLRCEIQNNDVCVWIELEKDKKPTEKACIRLFGTGWEFSGCYKYINSIFIHGGTFVYHAYMHF